MDEETDGDDVKIQIWNNHLNKAKLYIAKNKITVLEPDEEYDKETISMDLFRWIKNQKHYYEFTNAHTNSSNSNGYEAVLVKHLILSEYKLKKLAEVPVLFEYCQRARNKKTNKNNTKNAEPATKDQVPTTVSTGGVEMSSLSEQEDNNENTMIERVGTFDDEVEQTIVEESETVLMNEKSTKQNNNNNYCNKSWLYLTPCKRNYDENNDEDQSSNTAAARSTYVLWNSSQNINNNNNLNNLNSSAAFSNPTKKRNYSSPSLQEKENEKEDSPFFSIETTVTIPQSKHDINWEKRPTAARSEEIFINESSSSCSKKRSSTNSSSHQLTKRPRRSSRLKRQPQDQSCADKSDSEVDDENELEDFEPDEEISTNQSSSSQISTKKLTKREVKWRSKFQELRAYKRSNGNANVPRSNKQLGIWVNNQRREYRTFKKNGKSQITPERIQTLESIGFEWVSPNKGGPRNESAWNNRFNELKAYKEKNGRTNCYVSENKKLGMWVKKQRQQYKNFQKNGKGKITKERIEILDSIGFEWECRPGPAPRS